MAWTLQKFFSRFTRNKDVSGGSRAFGRAAGVSVNEETAMKVSAFHRGVMYISTQVAKLPKDVKGTDNVVQIDNPIQYLLNVSPNSEMNAFNFWLWAIQKAIINGNAYAEIERNGLGQPIGIWPINQGDCEPWRTSDGQLVYRVFGDSAGNQKALYIPARNILHIPNFHKTRDGRSGLGLVQFAVESIGISAGADRMAGSLFANSGIPSGIITVKGQLSPEATARLKETWDTSNQGRKAGGTRVLEDDAKYEPISVDAEALQFLESRKFGVLELARFLGLPPTKLYDNQATTFSNQENANLEVVTDTLDAWACNVEAECDMKLLSGQYGGRYVELDLKQLTRGDMKARADFNSKMMQMGAITPNQIRAGEGQPGYGPNGDKYFIATNNYTPADRIDEVIDADIKQKTTPKPAASPNDPAKAQLMEAAHKFLITSKG